MRPDSTIALPRSMRLTVPVSRLSSRSRKSFRIWVLADRARDLEKGLHLHPGRGRADAPELDRLERLLDDVAQLERGIAQSGIGDRDLMRRLLVLFVGHDGPTAK